MSRQHAPGSASFFYYFSFTFARKALLRCAV